MKHIVIFEDNIEDRAKLIKSLTKRLKGKAVIGSIAGNAPKTFIGKSYYDILYKMLMKFGTGKALVICDKDLSNLKPDFTGLSASTVAEVADHHGLPLCLYARGDGYPDGEKFLLSLRPWEKKRIILKFNDETLARDCEHVFKGFSKIFHSYMELPPAQSKTPAQALSVILGRPELEDRIALYGSGEQGFLEDIMPYIKRKKDEKEDLKFRMPRILGNWLYTSILRFPGIILNETAAASYLNIHPEDFSVEKIKKLFSKAIYKGPFEEMELKWWRDRLDDIILEAKCKDGLELVKKRHLKARDCKDSQTKARAGFYCMVTGEAVSENNSRGGISWFPSGADLARIRLDKFNELAPWVGLY